MEAILSYQPPKEDDGPHLHICKILRSNGHAETRVALLWQNIVYLVVLCVTSFRWLVARGVRNFFKYLKESHCYQCECYSACYCASLADIVRPANLHDFSL
jgi:hypothetical protein